MRRRSTHLFAVCLALLSTIAPAAPHVGRVIVETEDASPRFLAWFDAAHSAPDADARWALWQQMYGEAAVPPTPQGQALARRLVDAAWPRYASAVPAARAGLSPLVPSATATLDRVAATLGLASDAHVRLKGIVGGFEHNAYTYRADMPVVVVPLESIGDMPLAIAHEGTHAVQMAITPGAGGFERSLAYAALQEGLAMHIACSIVERATREQCIGGGAGFVDDATTRHDAIRRRARKDLDKRDVATLTRYSFGPGNTGLRRELYAIGWFAVDRLRNDGIGFDALARVPEADPAALIQQAIDEELQSR